MLASVFLVITVLLIIELINPGIVTDYKNDRAEIIYTYLFSISIAFALYVVISLILILLNKQRQNLICSASNISTSPGLTE